MKKLIFALCAILMLASLTALAEESTDVFKVTLWEHTAKDVDEAGNEIEVPVKVTLTLDQPVEINEQETEINDGFFAIVSREGVNPIHLAITPADFGPHANLNNATEEQLNLYLDLIAQDYDENEVIRAIRKTPSENVYLCAGVPTNYEIWQMYEDTLIDILQNSADGSDLTVEDQNFAVEVLIGIWME